MENVIIRSINPATEEINAEYPAHSRDEADSAIDLSVDAFTDNRKLPFAGRAEKLQQVADVLESDCSRFAALLTAEMGKTISASQAEVAKCARVCRYYAENGESLLRSVSLETDTEQSRLTYQPLGPIMAIMPWNFPFWQAFRCAAPAIMAGNVVLLKHASNVPGAALALQEIFERADFPPGTFQSLLIDSQSVGRVLEDSRVRAASVTGSVRAGSSVAAIAGKEVKKTVLELGGSDAFIVMPSADIEKAIEVGVRSRVQNNGQSCIAAKRFIVHESVHDEFVEGFAKELSRLSVGDPADEATDIGPLAQNKTRERLDKQVTALLSHGATRVVGARRRTG
ncbi:MAG: aldehyde dehydrogenase family protein, partial [Gammaproteobacteria bacterium]